MGDGGKLYVPAELVGAYRELVVPKASLLTPNQFEAELLTGLTIRTEADAARARALARIGSAAPVVRALL